ncbi:glycosyltransferase, partial [Candidatus Uhrbacteria bacterium]|nr:glycosyltransferase [Candidatus Uhrbacteria bacterium]
MKLLIATGIYPPEIGGPAGYVKGVATELAEQGHEVAVVTYGDNPDLNDKYKVIGVHRTSYIVQRYWKYFLEVYKLAKKSDLIYAQGPVSEGLPAAVASLFSRKPLVLKVVGDYAWEQYQQTRTTNFEPRTTISEGVLDKKAKYELLDEFVAHRHGGKIRILEAIERWVARRAKKIIVPSKYLKTIVEKWGVESDKINVVYNSISPLPEVASREELRKKHELGDRKLILTAVRAVPWKGGDFLCDCIKDLPEEYVLAVAGDGPSLESWKKHAEEIGVSDRVAWLGKLSRKDLTEFYQSADLFVLPTGYEGFPHVVVEAASMGLPCIVSDKGGNPEIAELFPGQISVAEYLNKQAWIEEINRISYIVHRTNHRHQLPGVLGFNRMVEETFKILKS